MTRPVGIAPAGLSYEPVFSFLWHKRCLKCFADIFTIFRRYVFEIIEHEREMGVQYLSGIFIIELSAHSVHTDEYLLFAFGNRLFVDQSFCLEPVDDLCEIAS